MTFRDADAAVAGGRVIALAGILVAAGLAVHPLPAGGFAERPEMLVATPHWGIAHAAIAAGFVLTAVGALLVLVGGAPGGGWLAALAWASMTVGMFFFTGVALINAWVMHALAPAALAGDGRALFDAFNGLLVGYGWLGDPPFLFGLTVVGAIEVMRSPLRLPRALAWAGLIFALLSWLRGIGSATGMYWLEPFVLANIPAFLWLGMYGLRIAERARMGGATPS